MFYSQFIILRFIACYICRKYPIMPSRIIRDADIFAYSQWLKKKKYKSRFTTYLLSLSSAIFDGLLVGV